MQSAIEDLRPKTANGRDSETDAEREVDGASSEVVRDGIGRVAVRAAIRADDSNPIVRIGVVDVEQVEEIEAYGHLLEPTPGSTTHELSVHRSVHKGQRFLCGKPETA